MDDFPLHFLKQFPMRFFDVGAIPDPLDLPFWCSRLDAVLFFQFSQCRENYQNISKIPPNWLPKSTKNQPKIDQKINQKLYRIFDHILLPKWSQNDPEMGGKNWKKLALGPLGGQGRPPGPPKAPMRPPELPKWSPRDPQSPQNAAQGTPRAPKMEPKGPPEGPKLSPRDHQSPQNGAEDAPDPQKGAQATPRVPKMETKIPDYQHGPPKLPKYAQEASTNERTHRQMQRQQPNNPPSKQPKQNGSAECAKRLNNVSNIPPKMRPKPFKNQSKNH